MRATDFDVVVAGDLNVDLILRGDVMPAFGQAEQLLDDAVLVLGSSAAIFACGAARLGLHVAFAGKVGADDFGRVVLRELGARGVDTAGVIVDPGVRTGLTVLLTHQGDRALLTYPGSIATLRYGEIDRQILSRARHLHLASYFLLDALRPDVPALFDDAHAQGLTVSLDTNYDPAGRWDGGLAEALARTDVFLPNGVEARAISGCDDVDGALETLSARVPTVAIKLGAQGAVAGHNGQCVRVPALPVDPVDATGAGDSFDAGFVYGYLLGWDLARTLELACACGALSTRGTGGTAAQATLDEALARM
jgi:sugar/nucleoside kinase (ribokinase family)